MLLKSLEISGFKSFAKKTTLEFNASIFAIVGPNGSGKSNVAEAFRFVLGEQSLKSLRGKRGEDLIFNGGKTLPRQNRASVKLIFDNKSKTFPIDFEEIAIERVVHRDGVNEYLLNGSEVRLKDISELLFSAHIGSSGHHIISQGEADRMLTASVKERREMLEEALGLRVYQVKKIEGERRLEKTAENILQIESLRREIAPHIKFLKKQVEKYERSLALREELKALYLFYFREEDKYIMDEKERLAESRKKPESSLSEIEDSMMALKEMLNKKDEHKKESQEIIDLQSGITTFRMEREEMVRNSGKIEAEIFYLERSIKEEESRARQDEQRTVLMSDVENLKDEIIKYTDEAVQVEDIGLLRKLILNIRNACKVFVEKRGTTNNNSEEKISLLQKEKSDKLKQKEEVDLKIREMYENEKKLRDEEVTIKLEIDKRKDDTFEAEKKMLELMAKEQEIQNELNNLRIEEERVKMLYDEFKRDLHEAGLLIGHEVLRFKDVDGAHLHAEHSVGVEGGVEESVDGRHQQIERRKEIERKKIRLEETGGGSGADIMKEFNEVTERDQFLERELIDLEQSSASLKVLIKDLDEKINTEFREGIQKINKEFENFFTLMFGGGHASLKLIDGAHLHAENRLLQDTYLLQEEVPSKEGIEIDVVLPHKKTKGLVMLSGGERALTSIALLFAISQVNPPPFIILDETDAALDEANSKKYGDMIERLSAHSGLILITHNRETMSRAGIIYGVTMGSDGFSKLLSIQFDEALAVAK